jgi:hypothetical protein
LALFIPASLAALVLGIALGRVGGVPVISVGLALPVVTMLGAMVADNLKEWLERRQPDPGDGPPDAGKPPSVP